MKVVTLISGGADSSTLLYYLMYQPEVTEIAPLAVNYGQRHKKELDAAKIVVEAAQKFLENTRVEMAKTDIKAKVPKNIRDLRVVDFPIGVFGGSPLVDLTDTVPTQADNLQPKTVVPYRNTMLATLAASYAKSLGFDSIAMGPTYEDLANYPDCRPMFFESLSDTLRLGDSMHHLKILTPFNELVKKQIYAIGNSMGVPYKSTWTCYNGREKACGVCDACKERLQGFKELGVNDPMEYETLTDETKK